MSSHRIGRYEVIRMLPGARSSYLAHAPGVGTCELRRIGPSNPADIARAVREVEACLRAGHPALSAAEIVADGDHVVWAIPEREGVALTRWMERLEQSGSIPEPAAVWHVVGEVAAALSTIHALPSDSGPIPLCHGALGPDWIWLGWDGTVFLDGAGLAAMAGASALRRETIFEAPEERQGGRPTPRGDVYSLAVVACRLLGGRIPGPEGVAASVPVALPSSLREVFVRALESTLSRRSVTAIELELAVRELQVSDGRQRLAEALRPLRRGTTLIGTMPITAASVAAVPLRDSVAPDRRAEPGAPPTSSDVSSSRATEPSRESDSPPPSGASVPPAAPPTAALSGEEGRYVDAPLEPVKPRPGSGETLRTRAAIVDAPNSDVRSEFRPGRIVSLGIGVGAIVFAMGLALHFTRERLPLAVDGRPPAEGSVGASEASSRPVPSAVVGESLGSGRPILDAPLVPTETAPTPSERSAAIAPTGAPLSPMGLDPATLGPNDAIVVPRFSGDPMAEVFSYATSLGKVNQPVVLPCKRYAYLRVGLRSKPSEPIHWLSAGRSQRLECRKVNEVVFEALPR